MVAAYAESALLQYANIMAEAKARLEQIESVRNGSSGIRGQFAKEFCFLQLRMTCELIALGCLTAHGDIGKLELGRLKKEYSADKIIQQLGDLKYNFYPVPYIQERHAPNVFHLTDATSAYLKKSDLLSLYRKCGDIVHRGTIKRLTAGSVSENAKFPVIGEWVAKVYALLNQHRIPILDGKMHLLCVLSNPDDQGLVYVAVVEALKPS